MDLVEQWLRDRPGVSWGCVPVPPPAQWFACRRAGLLPSGRLWALVFCFPYAHPPAFGGNISCYAAVPDYHRVIGDQLAQLAQQLAKATGHPFVPFVDSSPLDEVALAASCGLGIVGDNGLLITRQYGSYVFIGELITSCPLPRRTAALFRAGGCLHCGACQKVCPGGAIADGAVCTDRCLSHISQKKGELTGWEQRLVAGSELLWGCDRCQLCCPMNRQASPTALPGFLKDTVATVSKEQLRPLCKTRAFGFRGPQVLERNWALQHPGPAGEVTEQ
ncbi:Epoxyqueuosine reductase [Anaerotruncus sp. 2789STDY5834896]|uniref:Epoxyqueuosine reductase n=1 Tax=uncultured Anaerotruncus sp. TaxID=905011 RepID=A0A1C6KAG9_9FIRM|nr:Epoxyqueuosine reductase [uncultured Anaerotruncus sp.]